MDATKYIKTPDCKPLFAMRRCFGPTRGPIKEPRLTEIDVIKELLLQSGNEAVNIFEVKREDDGSFTKPVQLTLDNYMLPYDIIAGTEIEEEPLSFVQMIPDENKELQKPEAPVVEAGKPIEVFDATGEKEPLSEEDSNSDENNNSEDEENSDDQNTNDGEDTSPNPDDDAEDDETAQSTSDPATLTTDDAQNADTVTLSGVSDYMESFNGLVFSVVDSNTSGITDDNNSDKLITVDETINVGEEASANTADETPVNNKPQSKQKKKK